jgi:hypothetical protein
LGEQYDGKVHPKIFLADISSLSSDIKVTAVPTPDNLAVGDPQLYGSSETGASGGLSIAYTGWEIEKKRYGFVYCPIRPAAIFKQEWAGDVATGDAGSDAYACGTTTAADTADKMKMKPAEKKEEEEAADAARWSEPVCLSAGFDVAHSPRYSIPPQI